MVFGQIAQTAACNRLHGIEARASRWLLQAHDRFGDDQVPLTQASTCCECYGVMRGELERLFPFLQA